MRARRWPSPGPAQSQLQVDGDTWYTSDIHLHANGCKNDDRSSSEILELMKAGGVNIGSALAWSGGEPLNRDAPKLRGQQDDPVSEEHFILHWDVEISGLPGDWHGHMDFLNASKTDIFVESGGSYIAAYPGQDYLLPNYDFIQAGGGLVGYGHGHAWTAGVRTVAGWRPQRELPLDVVLARVDFYATEYLNEGWEWLWYQMFDAGFQIPGLGTSDLGCIHDSAGAYTGDFFLPRDQTLSYAAFIQAVAAGRTVVKRKIGLAERDFLDLRVNDARIGARVELAASEPTVEVQATARTVTANATLQLIQNGEVIRAHPITGALETVTWTVSVDRSGWLAAKTLNDQTVNAHTSAIFVIKEGCPVRNDPAGARAWGDYLEEYFEVGAATGVFGDSIAEVRQKVDEAKRIWTRIAEEGEGKAPMPCKAAPPRSGASDPSAGGGCATHAAPHGDCGAPGVLVLAALALLRRWQRI